MQDTGSVLITHDKNTELIEQPSEDIIQLIPNASPKHLFRGETIEIKADRLLWIDLKHRLGVLAAFRLPKSARNDYSCQVALATTLDHAKRRQFILAPYDGMGSLHNPTYLHNPTLHVIFGRDGLFKKALHMLDNTEFISHIPRHDEAVEGIMGQVGSFTSSQHLSINLMGPLLRLKDVSEHGSIAYTA